MNKWKVRWMVDPGDGIVSKATVEHPSDDICEVAADLFNGWTPEDGDEGDNGSPCAQTFIISLELQPPEAS